MLISEKKAYVARVLNAELPVEVDQESEDQPLELGGQTFRSNLKLQIPGTQTKDQFMFVGNKRLVSIDQGAPVDQMRWTKCELIQDEKNLPKIPELQLVATLSQEQED